MYSVRSDIGSASTISGDPTTALANGFSIRRVRDLLTVTTMCRTAPLSSFCGCARACCRGPGATPTPEAPGRIWTNIPKSALKTRGVRLRSNAAYVYNAGGVDSGWLCDPKRTYDPRARRISRALERIDGANTAANSSAKGARV